jgi:hypothetical protein
LDGWYPDKTRRIGVRGIVDNQAGNRNLQKCKKNNPDGTPGLKGNAELN